MTESAQFERLTACRCKSIP